MPIKPTWYCDFCGSCLADKPGYKFEGHIEDKSGKQVFTKLKPGLITCRGCLLVAFELKENEVPCGREHCTPYCNER